MIDKKFLEAIDKTVVDLEEQYESMEGMKVEWEKSRKKLFMQIQAIQEIGEAVKKFLNI